MSSRVSRPPAAESNQAQEHFSRLLAFETDCWDVHHGSNLVFSKPSHNLNGPMNLIVPTNCADP